MGGPYNTFTRCSSLVQGKRRSIILPNKCRDAYSFEDILALQRKIYSDRIPALDLSRIEFIEPYSLVNLLLLGRNYLRRTGSKLELINIPLQIYLYMLRMDFFSYGIFTVTQDVDQKLLYKKSAFSNRVVEITEIPGKERESIKVISGIIGIFRKRANHILKYWLSAEIIDYFVTVISEVCQNIFEHSLDSGFFAIQTYAVGSEHVVRLIIADSGIGIAESFTGRSDIVHHSNAQLIELSLTTPISSKRRFGYGLCQVNAILEKLRGSIFIRSADSSVAVLYNRKQGGASSIFCKNDLTLFPGTQISISLTA